MVDLPVVQAPVAAGAEVLLDTCVYIDQMQGKAPPFTLDGLTLKS